MTKPTPATTRRPLRAPARRGLAGGPRGRALLLAGGGAAIGVLVLVVAWNLDRSDAGATSEGTAPPLADDENVIDLVPPDPDADPGEGRGDGPSRGWIQITGDDGELAQQYRCERLDPDPPGHDPGWLSMGAPQLEVFLDDGGVLVLEGDEALVFAPEAGIESGTLEGDVRIRLYEDAGVYRDATPAAPALPQAIVRTDTASFNSLLGEIRCPGPLSVESPELVFTGTGLRALLADEGGLAFLKVDAVDRVRFPQAPGDEAAGGVARRDSSAPRPVRGRVVRLAAQSAPPAPADDVAPPVHYRLVLSDRVRIATGPRGLQRTADGTRLELVFTDRSEGLGDALGAAPRERTERIERGRALAGLPAARIGPTSSPASWREAPLAGRLDPRRTAAPMARVASAARHGGGTVRLASNQPSADATIPRSPDGEPRLAAPARADDVVVTCDGPLVVRPIEARASGLGTPEEARMDLVPAVGERVLLTDEAGPTLARAALLRYGAPAGRLELLGGPLRTEDDEDPDDPPAGAGPFLPVLVEGPELRLDAECLELVDAESRGRLHGAGSMDVRGERVVHARWRDGVDLAFADDEGAEAPASGLGLGRLRSVRLEGDARLDADAVDPRAEAAQPTAPERATPKRGASQRGGLDLLGGGDDAGEGGALAADTITIDLVPGAAGGLDPSRLVADGTVEAASGARRLWADRLDARLARVPRKDAGADADDTEVQVRTVDATGAVQLRLEGARRVYADRLEVDAARGTARLTGDDVHLADGPSLLDRATVVVVDDAAGTARVEGRGRYFRFDGPVLDDPVDAEPVPLGRPDPAQVAGAREALRITWADGLDFGPAGSGGEPAATPDAAPTGDRRIDFRGDVRVRTPDLALRGADRLTVTLAGDDEAAGDAADPAAGTDPNAERLRTIEAVGAIDAERRGAYGRVRAQRVLVGLAPATDGGTRLDSLLAEGGVEVADRPETATDGEDAASPDATVDATARERRIWADRLDLTFVETAPGAPPEDPAPARDDDDDVEGDEALGGDVELATALATGRVQLRLPDGERVLASRLDADARAGTAVLRGADGSAVLLASPDGLLEDAQVVTVDDATGRATVEGAGRFRSFDAPMVLPPAATPASADDLRAAADAATPVLVARWTRDASVERARAAGPGPDGGPDLDAGRRRIRFGGDVVLEAAPNPLEASRVRGDQVTIDLRSDDAPAASVEDGPDAAGALDGAAAGGLERLVARGAARLETSRWPDAEARSSGAPPTVFAVDGREIDWRQADQSADVIGPGLLLLNEPRADADAGEDRAGFSGAGTTRFTWERTLILRPRPERVEAASGPSRWIAVMEGDVSCVHLPLPEPGTTGRPAADTLTCERLEAVFRRLAPTGDAAAASEGEGGRGTLELGGDTEIERLVGVGGATIVTEAREVVCDRFDYDLATGIAELSAAEGGRVFVQSRDGRTPISSARRVRWDMRRDVVVVEGAGGRGSPGG